MSHADTWPPDLWNSQIAAKDAISEPVLGTMARYVGRWYTAEEIWHYYRISHDVYPNEDAQLRPLATRIRAFDVPGLRDTAFTVRRLRGVAPALLALLLERLPGVARQIDDASLLQRIKKYGLIHQVMPAPLDEATGEPMVLEVYGRLAQVNGEPAGIKWYDKWGPKESVGNMDTEIGELTFRVKQATYANTSTPGIGVPFYI